MKDSKNPARRWRRNALAATLLASTALGGYVVAFAAAPSPNAPMPQTQQMEVNNPSAAQPGAPVNTQQQAAMPERLPSFTHLVAQVKPELEELRAQVS